MSKRKTLTVTMLHIYNDLLIIAALSGKIGLSI